MKHFLRAGSRVGGRIVNNEEFVSRFFKHGDGTDQIRVDIDDDDFPNVPVGENTRVRIHGEVEFDYRDSPEIDVERLEVR